MIRSFFAVLGGMILWAVLWISTNSLVSMVFADRFTKDPETNEVMSMDPLILGLTLTASVLFAVVAGAFTAKTARRREMLHAGILGGIQLAIGVAVQTAYWGVFPLWYHVLFLGFQVPGYLLGARLLLGRRVV